jgi:hypothetical protein
MDTRVQLITSGKTAQVKIPEFYKDTNQTGRNTETHFAYSTFTLPAVLPITFQPVSEFFGAVKFQARHIKQGDFQPVWTGKNAGIRFYTPGFRMVLVLTVETAADTLRKVYVSVTVLADTLRQILGNEACMTVAQLLYGVRQRIFDTDKKEYEDTELLQYLNDAITWLNGYLLQHRPWEMVKELEMFQHDRMPLDFVRFAGKYPIGYGNRVIELWDGADRINVRYLAAKPRVKKTADFLPFVEQYVSVLLQITANFALNRNAFDISQDKGLLAELVEVMG